VFLSRNENAAMANKAAPNSMEVKTMKNSNWKHLFALLVQIFKQQFT